MRADDWHLTDDVDDFLARAGDFLRSRPALHTVQLTTTEKLRSRPGEARGTAFGVLGSGDEVRAACYRRADHRLTLTRLSAEQADALAALLVRLDHPVTAVTADEDSAAAFAGAWQRRTGAVPVPGARVRLYRLGVLTPPEPLAAGRGRPAGARDHDEVVRWCGAVAAEFGEAPPDTGSWARSRFAGKHFTFWHAPDGTPVSLTGATSPIAGMVRVDPVYTPPHLRGRGYAGAVTAEVSRAALAAGATDVVLFADPANPTSNALYQRLGYVPLTDFTPYSFG